MDTNIIKLQQVYNSIDFSTDCLEDGPNYSEYQQFAHDISVKVKKYVHAFLGFIEEVIQLLRTINPEDPLINELYQIIDKSNSSHSSKGNDNISMTG